MRRHATYIVLTGSPTTFCVRRNVTCVPSCQMFDMSRDSVRTRDAHVEPETSRSYNLFGEAHGASAIRNEVLVQNRKLSGPRRSPTRKLFLQNAVTGYPDISAREYDH